MRVGPSFEQMIATAEIGSGMSLSMIPPCIVARWGRWWRLAMLTPATSTFCSFGRARITSPVLPRFFPESTCTRSPFLIRTSDHLRRERDDAHEALVAKLPADGAEDARPARLELLVDQH